MEPFVGQITLFPFSFARPAGPCARGRFCRSRNTQRSSRSWAPITAATELRTSPCRTCAAALRSVRARARGFRPIRSVRSRASRRSVFCPRNRPPIPMLFRLSLSPRHQRAQRGSAGRRPRLGSGRGCGEHLRAFAPRPPRRLAAGQVGVSGGNQPHTNLQPYLALNWCIALQGIFPFAGLEAERTTRAPGARRRMRPWPSRISVRSKLFRSILRHRDGRFARASCCRSISTRRCSRCWARLLWRRRRQHLRACPTCAVALPPPSVRAEVSRPTSLDSRAARKRTR